MLATGLVISTLTARLRQQAEAAREREARTAALYAMSRDLAAAPGEPEILQAAARHIKEVFLSQVLLLLPDAAGGSSSGRPRASPTSTTTRAGGRPVGLRPRPHGGKDHRHPARRKGALRAAADVRGVVGVLGLHPADPRLLVAPERLHLLEAFANQIALAVD